MSRKPSLGERLAAVRANAKPENRERYDRLVQSLVEADVVSGALKAGDLCPDFTLANAEGSLVSLKDYLARGPLVLSFYRGKWCPFCATELEALEDALPDILDRGATLVCVTAECGGGALAAKRRKGLRCEILCDVDNGLALGFGLVFRLPPNVREYYKSIGIDFPQLYGNESHFLPIPGTFIVGTDGVIAHAYVNPEFRERLDPEIIVKVLDTLKASASA
jgi:peroxiredoxin